MATLTNPTEWDIFCHAHGALVLAGTTVDVSEETAEALAGNSVFVVGLDAVPAHPEPAGEPTVPAEPMPAEPEPAGEITSP